MPSQVSWPCPPVFSGLRPLVPHPSGLRCPDAQPSSLECRHQPSGFPGPRQGEVTGCASRCCPANPGSCLLPSPPLGTGAGALPEGLPGPSSSGTPEGGAQGVPWGIPQHTHLSLPLLPSPGVQAQGSQQSQASCPQAGPRVSLAWPPQPGLLRRCRCVPSSPPRTELPFSTSTQASGPQSPEPPAQVLEARPPPSFQPASDASRRQGSGRCLQPRANHTPPPRLRPACS